MTGCCGQRIGLLMLLLVFGAGVSCQESAPRKAAEEAPKPGAPAAMGHDCPMLGCTIHRNMANTVEKNILDDWSVKKGQEKNIKWSAPLGINGYGAPVIAGGKVFIGTNNEKPRDPAVKGDKGILMCFDAGTGKFLWQAVHDKLDNPDERTTGPRSA
jgi:hypothetical protein